MMSGRLMQSHQASTIVSSSLWSVGWGKNEGRLCAHVLAAKPKESRARLLGTLLAEVSWL